MKRSDTYHTERVSLSKIDFHNGFYRASKAMTSDGLVKSIREFGILNPPLLKKESGIYIIIDGFNRLRAAASLGHEEVDAYIAGDVDADQLISLALVREYHKTIGPAGKIRLISILKTRFNYGSEALFALAVKGFAVPEFVMKDNGMLEAIDGLPDAMKRYLDAKDVGFKVIRSLVSLPGRAVLDITGWVSDAGMKVNVFKSIIDLLTEIHRRDGSLACLDKIDSEIFRDRKEMERNLYDYFFNVRFPEYSSMKQRADDVIGYFRDRGVDINFPQYFDGGSFDMILRINRRDSLESIKNRLNNIDRNRLGELMDFL